MAYREAWGIVGFGVLCDGFSHDMGDRGMRVVRAVVYFSHASFKKPGKDSHDYEQHLCMIVI